MSNGALFNLISNTSKADKLLYANQYLKDRILQIINEKKTKYDLTLPDDGSPYSVMDNALLPSLNEIEKSHNTYINASYKPNVMMASEYVKVQNSDSKFGSTMTYQFPQIGHFSSDSVLHIRLSNMQSIDARDRVRYVAMLGHKLVTHVQFVVNNGGILDEYYTDDYNAYYQYEVQPRHKNGYLRNIGQEIPTLGYITPDPSIDQFREYKLIGDGNQTLKYSHGIIDLYVPLLFWFKDQKNALPQLPWGQLQIKVTLANVIDIVGKYDGGGGGAYIPPTVLSCDLYVNQLFTIPEVFELYSKKFVFSIIRTHKSQKQTIDSLRGDTKYEILLYNLKWPVEVLWFSFRPRENLSNSQYWHKGCKLLEKNYKTPVVSRNMATVTSISTISGTSNTVSISNTLSGSRTTYNNYSLIITGGKGYNEVNCDNNMYTIIDFDNINQIFTIEGTWNGFIPDSTTVFDFYISQLAFNSVVYYREQPVVSSISLTSNGIDIYKDNSEAFYNSYIPTKYENVNTSDLGIYMISFCSKPLQHNPSGSFDLSVCRQTYLNFSTSEITTPYPVDVIILSRAINFIIVDNGINLKYST